MSYILYTGWSRYERKQHRNEEKRGRREGEREGGGGAGLNIMVGHRPFSEHAHEMTGNT